MNDESLFHLALEKPPAERAAFLKAACGGDEALLQRVERLLTAHDNPGGFLARPSASAPLAYRTGGHGALISDDLAAPDLSFLTPASRPGSLGRLDHYEILEIVGSGAFGIVLKAHDDKLHRVVAIKALRPSLAVAAAARQSFIGEAQAAAAVSHDNIVAIHAVEEADPVPYLVMEFIDGVSLEQRLEREGPLKLTEVLRIGLQTAQGLAAAHRQGLVHRDVKPGNILLQNGVERVKITDFGLARAVDDGCPQHADMIAGTPSYMSPEQAHGANVDQRSDLFSLGSVLYAMCTGHSPFRADTTLDVIRRVCADSPRPLREENDKTPAWLAAIIDRLLAKDPRDRFQSAAEVAALLEHHLKSVQLGETPEPSTISPPPLASKTADARGSRRTIGSHWSIATITAVLLIAAVGLLATEATGVTRVAASIIQILTPAGTLIVEVDDPQIQITVEGDGGLIITGAGPQELRLRPGSYHVRPSKDGKPLPEEAITISRGGKRIVAVRCMAEAAPLPGPSAVSAFVVLNRASRAERAYATLAEAIVGSNSGDTIEIRGNGPFTTQPLGIASRRSIRAGQGFQPLIRIQNSEDADKQGTLQASGPLILEGLDFEHSVRGAAAIFAGGPLHVANCRFTRCHLASDRSPIVHVKNCQFVTNRGSPLRIGRPMRVVLDNNVSITVAGFAAVSFTIRADTADCRLALSRNTLMGGGAITLQMRVGSESRDGNRVQMDVVRNVLVGLGSAVHCNVVSDSPALLPAEWRNAERIERHLRQIVAWREERNVYGDGAPLLGLSIGPMQSFKSLPTTRPMRTMAAYNEFWRQADDQSVHGTIHFQGGDLFAKAELASTPLTHDDLRLSEQSAGRHAAPDGNDLGPNLDLVGPGPAYERWKSTPGYEEWLKETANE
jgi:serine/threonine protein kinase